MKRGTSAALFWSEERTIEAQAEQSQLLQQRETSQRPPERDPKRGQGRASRAGTAKESFLILSLSDSDRGKACDILENLLVSAFQLKIPKLELSASVAALQICSSRVVQRVLKESQSCAANL